MRNEDEVIMWTILVLLVLVLFGAIGMNGFTGMHYMMGYNSGFGILNFVYYSLFIIILVLVVVILVKRLNKYGRKK